jgi:hypothetical protein
MGGVFACINYQGSGLLKSEKGTCITIEWAIVKLIINRYERQVDIHIFLI